MLCVSHSYGYFWLINWSMLPYVSIICDKHTPLHTKQSLAKFLFFELDDEKLPGVAKTVEFL